MNDYEFTLTFTLPASRLDPEVHLEALAAAGCDDALVGVGQPGRIALDFSRGHRSAFEAIASALRDVQRAIPGAALVEASPDFVGLTDVADLLGFSRQNMRKLMVANPATFPAAVHDGKPALWHLASVLDWLVEQQRRTVDASLRDVANATMLLNVARETLKLPGATLPRRLKSLLA
jgi:hypothetical protein